MKINLASNIHALGDTAMTVEFGETIDRTLSARVMAARHAVERAKIPGVVETVPTFRSLTVHFDPAAIGFGDLATAIGELDADTAAPTSSGRAWRVPVLYDGPDLDDIARTAGLSVAETVALHSGSAYHVYMLGFLPGFAYLGDLPRPLRLPRLKEPRTRVPAGSVAIADQLTAVYPVESPGGWRLIGRTPLRLFDVAAERPSLFEPGDTVSFASVGAAEFADAEAAISAGRYTPEAG